MKHTMKRTLSALLALLMLTPLAACGSQNEEVEDTAAVTEPVTETTVPSRENTPDNLPADLNYGGRTIRNFYYGNWKADTEGEDSGDLVKSAVYYANLAVAERLNIDYQLIASDINAQTSIDSYKNAVLSDSHEFEIAAVLQYLAAKQVTDHVFADLKDAKYLDLEQPWWNREYMDKTMVTDDHIFFLVGDILPSVLRQTSCVYFNKSIYENNFGDPDQMYEIVDNNEWNYDKVREMSQVVYVDMDSDGTVSPEDTLGFTTFAISPMEHFTLNAGVRFSERGDDGLYRLIGNSEHTISFIEKLYQLLYETTGVYVYVHGKSEISDSGKFSEDEALFLFGYFSNAFSARLREMESDYGIIPYPKLTSEQEKYLSAIHDNIALYCVPVFASEEEIEVASAVMEALSAENYRHVFPTMYDTALKVKYNRDNTAGDAASRMIDIIHDNATTDFVYVYNYTLCELGTIARKMMLEKRTTFASTYKNIERAANKALENLIASVQEP